MKIRLSADALRRAYLPALAAMMEKYAMPISPADPTPAPSIATETLLEIPNGYRQNEDPIDDDSVDDGIRTLQRECEKLRLGLLKLVLESAIREAAVTPLASVEVDLNADAKRTP